MREVRRPAKQGHIGAGRHPLSRGRCLSTGRRLLKSSGRRVNAIRSAIRKRHQWKRKPLTKKPPPGLSSFKNLFRLGGGCSNFAVQKHRKQ